MHGAAKHANFCAGLELAGDARGVSAFNLRPLVAEPHDRVGSGRHFGPIRAFEALAEDRFNFLPVNHLELTEPVARTS
jgi:hypothetical protein